MAAASWALEARLVGLALLLGGCDAVLGLEPWDAEPGATSSSTTSSSTASGGAAPTGSSTSGGGDGGGGGSGGGCAPGACGTCELGCWGDDACVDDVCTPVVLASGELADIPLVGGHLVVAGDHLAWIDEDGRVQRTRKSTAVVDTLHEYAIEQPSGLAASVAAERVVYSNANGLLRWISLEPGDEPPSGDYPTNDLPPVHLVTVDSDVMWIAATEDEGAGVYRSSTASQQPVRRVPLRGVVSFSPLKEEVYYVRQDAGGGLWRDDAGNTQRLDEPGTRPLVVVADAATDWVYVASDEIPDDAPPRIRRWQVGRSWETVAETGTAVSRLVLGGKWLYWIDADEHLVAAATEPGLAPVRVIADGPVTALAADEQGVYWADASNRIWGLRRSPP